MVPCMCAIHSWLDQYIIIPSLDKDRIYRGSFTGIGFSAKTKEYKVLQTSCSNYNCNEPEARIYTIGIGVWRSLGKPPSIGGIAEIPFNSFLHGALHWLPIYFNRPQLIQSFDFETEEFRPLLPPASLKEFKYYDDLRLGVLKGCIFLCVFGCNDRTSDMWILKDYGVQESWTKILVIENLYPSGHNPNYVLQ
ncbi:F-box protein At3g07870-like [Rosa rugosa]|uniref:F-box protein At3g07870-like n=1 Tax=Rosa rugosa TaxID=74645 RepID=UPI002B415D74|nr:F-box protein At3g07870-like [Rosa rugosa]